MAFLPSIWTDTAIVQRPCGLHLRWIKPALRPALVLADEPAGNLDTKSSDAVFALLRKVNLDSGTTFLIVTHDPRLAQRCDRIIELVDGQLVTDRAESRMEPALQPSS